MKEMQPDNSLKNCIKSLINNKQIPVKNKKKNANFLISLLESN